MALMSVKFKLLTLQNILFTDLLPHALILFWKFFFILGDHVNEITEFDVENIWDNASFQLNRIYNKGPVVF